RRKPEPSTLRGFVGGAKDAIAAHEADAASEAPPPGRPPKVGDTVEVVGRGIRGELIELAGERARLQRGGLKFEVPSAPLRVVSGAAAAPRVTAQVTTPEPETPSTEINLVGRRAQDAVAALGPFLDRAVRTGATEVRVVTGIGSGALRRAVQEFLASSPYC